MTDPSRQLIAWVGSEISEEMSDAFKQIGLTLITLTVEDVKANSPSLRAVLLMFSREPSELAALRGRLTALIPTINAGVMLAVITNPKDYAAASSIAAHVERALGDGPGRIQTIPVEIYAVARRCAGHVPGPAVNEDLVLTGDLTAVSDEERVLLKRAFHHSTFSRLEIANEDGGRSAGTRVWRVNAFLSDGQCCEPFIVKSGRRLAILEEYQTWKAFVHDHVPFPFRPPVYEGRLVEGATRSLLVSLFVTRAQRFDLYATTIAGTQLAVSALFDGPLRNWRTNLRRRAGSLGQAYVEEQEAWTAKRAEDEKLGRPNLAVLPEPTRLEAAYEIAKRTERRIPSPTELYEFLNKTKVIDYAECRGHGDLNARNLFVRWNGLDVILIDFSHAGLYGALSRDPARLEVSLAFDAPDARGRYVSQELLFGLYDAPLLPCRMRSVDDGRVEAIRQIRTHVGGDGVSDIEYRISVGAHLLRYARVAREGELKKVLQRKGLAYRLAAKLIRSTL